MSALAGSHQAALGWKGSTVSKVLALQTRGPKRGGMRL